MSTINTILQPILNKWLLPLGILITLLGYFGPWVNHHVAGLVVMHWIMRVFFVIIAIVAALNMLPPAWAPWKLRLPEFQLQTMLIIFCLVMMLISPFLALIPKRVRAIVATILAILSIWFPAVGFWRVLPTVSDLYNQPIWPGWGLYIMVIGLLLLLIGAWQADKSAQPQAQAVKNQLIENQLIENQLSEEVV